jgi:hypothetical protein
VKVDPVRLQAEKCSDAVRNIVDRKLSDAMKMSDLALDKIV